MSSRSPVHLRNNAEIEVSYITERMLVLTFPRDEPLNGYKRSLKEISQMLKTKHGPRYKVFNLSQRRQDLSQLNMNVAEYGWPEELAPPLERLCALCKDMENWLNVHEHNIVVIHSKGDKNRPAVLVAAYLHYSNICASEDDQALERFAMRRFTEDISSLAHPSHKRYVMYFSGLLSGAIKINSSAIFLQHIAILGLPSVNGKACRPFIKIYEKMVPVMTSPVFFRKIYLNSTRSYRNVEYKKELIKPDFSNPSSDRLSFRLSSPLSLRGDVLIKCYHRNCGFGATVQNRQLVFRCQFNTCALDLQNKIGTNRISFAKSDLDSGDKGATIPDYGRVQLLFSLNPDLNYDLHYEANTADDGQVLPRTNSYEDFERTLQDDAPDTELQPSSSFAEGPLTSHEGVNGNGLYASVNKSVKKDFILHSTTSQPFTSSSNQSSPPLPNESTDSGISTTSQAAVGKLASFPVHQHTHMNGGRPIDDDDEPVIVQAQRQRATIDTIDTQISKLFADDNIRASHVQDVHMQRRVHLEEEPQEIVIDTSVSSTDPRKEPPAVLPKPSAQPNEDYPMEFQYRQPVLPPGSAKRPLSPPVNADGQPTMIDVDLVGKERYDPQSKAFSYVPKQALQDHFKSPKVQRRWVQQVEGADGELVQQMTEAETLLDEWTSEVSSNPPEPVQSMQASVPVAPSSTHSSDGFRRVNDSSANEQQVEERPTSVNQRSKTRKTKYNKYKSLDDYESDMDELCDPDYYLKFASGAEPPTSQSKPVDTRPGSNIIQSTHGESYEADDSSPASAPPIPPPPVDSFSSYAHKHSGGAPPRKPEPPSSYVSSSERESLGAEETFESSGRMPSGRDSYGRPTSTKRVNNSWDALDKYKLPDLPRLPLSSRSVTSTPVHTTSRYARSNSERFSFSSDFDPDDWLEHQLEKLKFKREINDVDFQKRKQQERLLLDELKHIHEDRMISRQKNEDEYSTEGFGTKSANPVDEWKQDEERLRNARSPFIGHHTSHIASRGQSPPTRRANLSRQSSDTDRSRLQHPYVARKPPTPPPRERSRTPPSPRRMSPIRNPPSYDQVMARRATPPPPEVPPQPAGYGYGYSSDMTDTDSVSERRSRAANTGLDQLESLLWDTDEPLTPAMTSTPENSRQHVHQSPKSILKKPRFPGDIYSKSDNASGTSLISNGPLSYSGSQSPLVSARSAYNNEPTAQRTKKTDRTTGYVVVDSNCANRPETPAFPIKRNETPVPYHPLLFEGAEQDSTSPNLPRTAYNRPATAPPQRYHRSPSPGSMYYGQSRRSSLMSLGEPMEVIHHHPVFVKDTSKYWYKASISREDAISILKDKPPGTFIVRDSNSFPGAFGLALKVATPPAGVQSKTDGTELVRHFLIEPSAKGVKLKGCNNEPVFGSLSALVYQHSITPLALPCKLILPEYDPAATPEHTNSAAALLEQGAESLTGPEAVRRVVDQAFQLLPQKALALTSVHFKVSSQGITVTDNTRKLFFRRHYPVNSVTFCGIDPDDRRWTVLPAEGVNAQTAVTNPRIFGFVAKKIASRTDNVCHVFAELEPEQPATAVVNFITKVMMSPLHSKQSL